MDAALSPTIDHATCWPAKASSPHVPNSRSPSSNRLSKNLACPRPSEPIMTGPLPPPMPSSASPSSRSGGYVSASRYNVSSRATPSRMAVTNACT